jgi:hypothetical protein
MMAERPWYRSAGGVRLLGKVLASLRGMKPWHSK